MTFSKAIQKYEDQAKRLEVRALCAKNEEERRRIERKREGILKLLRVLRSFNNEMETR